MIIKKKLRDITKEEFRTWASNGTMYQGMELERAYTLEELGL